VVTHPPSADLSSTAKVGSLRRGGVGTTTISATETDTELPTKTPWDSALWRGRASRLIKSSAFLGLALTVIAWPTSRQSLFVTGGLDQSWRAAVAMAVHNRLHFGSQAVFTYGPLAFLVSPQAFYRSEAFLGILFTLGFSMLTFAALIWALRRHVPLSLALVAAFLVGGLTRASATYFGTRVAVEDVLALALLFGVVVLSTPDRRRPDRTWLAIGVGLAIFTLIKVSLGVGLGAIFVIIVAFLPMARLRAAVALLLGGTVTFATIWFATGNGIDNLFAYLRSCLEIALGYGGAMSIESPGRWYSYWLAVLIVLTTLAFAWGHARRFERRIQIAILLITVVTLWFLFKESFVRHDGHDLAFFVAAPIIIAAFLPGWRSPSWVIAAVLCSVAVTGSVAGSVPVLTVQPVQAFQNFWRETSTVLSAARTAHVMSRSRVFLREKYGLTSAMLNDMRDHTVDVSPWEQTVAWAYPSLRFDPLPVIQDYSAYTPYLDGLDVGALRSSRAPMYILRSPDSQIDQRNTAWDAPAEQLSIACRYQVVAATSQWQLLRRGADRCGRSDLIERVTVALGHSVAVPSIPAGDLLTATFDFAHSATGSVLADLYKPPSVYMDANGGRHVWRFITSTGPDPHLFNGSLFQDHVTSFRFHTRGFGQGFRRVTITFFELPIR
jgi:hypothetical protein